MENILADYRVRQYVTITRDFPLAAAKAFRDLTPQEKPFRFIYVSSGGATTAPATFTPFSARVKGETELALSELCTSTFHVVSVRPVGVDASNHAAIKAYMPDPGLAYNVMAFCLLPLIRTVFKSLHSPTEHLGPFLMGLAMGQYDAPMTAGGSGITTIKESRILENSAFRRMYESSRTSIDKRGS